MYIQSTFSKEFYLQHQEHFDSRLIKLLDQYASKISEQHQSIEIYEANNLRNAKIIKDLKFLNHDMKTTIYNLNQKLKDKDMEIDDLIKNFEELIKKQNNIVSKELNHSYKENTKLHNENEKLKEELHD